MLCLAIALVAGCSRDEPSANGADPDGTDAAPAPAAPPESGADVSFRALGQEPGWILEIRPEQNIDFRYDYAERRVVTPVPVPEISGRQTVYHAVTEANDLRIEIVEEACQDVMSGDAYPATVRVTLNGTAYDGCGGRL